MARFTLPRDIYWGKGTLETLKTLTGKKAMVVVGGGSMKRFGFLDKTVEYLKEAGMEVRLFENVEPDPSVAVSYTHLAQCIRSLGRYPDNTLWAHCIRKRSINCLFFRFAKNSFCI